MKQKKKYFAQSKIVRNHLKNRGMNMKIGQVFGHADNQHVGNEKNKKQNGY